jgi:hypothetical protein
MLVRGSNGLEVDVEEQVATAMITAGIVEAVTGPGAEPAPDETPEADEGDTAEETSKKSKK